MNNSATMFWPIKLAMNHDTQIFDIRCPSYWVFTNTISEDYRRSFIGDIYGFTFYEDVFGVSLSNAWRSVRCIPVTLKSDVILEIVILYFQALLNSCENWYLVTTIPGFAMIKSWQTCFQHSFNQLKHPLLRSWDKCMVLGGKAKRVTWCLTTNLMCLDNSEMCGHPT